MHLNPLDVSGMPCGMGSGCLVRCGGIKLLLSVSHLLRATHQWNLHVKSYPPPRYTQAYQFGAPTTVKRLSLSNARKVSLDFFAVPIPDEVTPIHQEVRGIHAIIDGAAKRVFEFDEITEPSSSEEYAFFGLTQGLQAGVLFECVPIHVSRLKFCGENQRSLIFELPYAHPGHDFFKGCSGAPIVDSRGRLVSLVQSGSLRSNRVLGYPLSKYAAAIAAISMEHTPHDDFMPSTNQTSIPS